MKNKWVQWALPAMVLLTACSKDDETTTPSETIKPTVGAYVMSEGTFSGNNARLSYYDNATGNVVTDFFKGKNNSDLGGLGNDAIIYGSKLYIIMNLTSNVTVTDAKTGTLLKRIELKNGTVSRQPRYAVGHNGKVYVTSYDGTVAVVDTSTLNATQFITVGANPEGIAVRGNYLYVANSGGLNAVPDSTVSVIDITTNTEIKKIKVGVNPNKVEINSAGEVFVSSYGNFGSIPASIHIIDATTNTYKASLGSAYPYSHLRIYNDVAYLYNNYSFTPSTAGCVLVDTKTKTQLKDKFITDGTIITQVYGLNIDESNGDVYFTDAKDFTNAGQVTCFDKDGKKKFAFNVGVNPNKVVFLR
jgi:YVTN family beta-propeller protein